MIKKIGAFIICFITVLTAFTLSASAANGTASLASITFKNGVINEKFSPDVQDYTITLEDNQASPTLESYKINGDAELFITYTYDDANHQTGVVATLKYDKGSMIYNFVYSNPAVSGESGDNLLSSIICTYGEISPELNDEDTAYKLYIPCDLTDIVITPVTNDINAYCPSVELTLDETQEPKITLCSKAANSSQRNYTLEIKRVDKTLEQVKLEMQSPDFKSFVDGTRLYQKPEFIISVSCIGAGIVVLAILFVILRRVAISPYDKDEKPFYAPVE